MNPVEIFSPSLPQTGEDGALLRVKRRESRVGGRGRFPWEGRMEIKNYGVVRGGANEEARFFLHVVPQGVTGEELSALFVLWDEEFGLNGCDWVGWCYRINSRREFALVPAMIRKAQRLGYDVKTSMWDVGIKDSVKLSESPVEFWQILAMSQAYFKE